MNIYTSMHGIAKKGLQCSFSLEECMQLKAYALTLCPLGKFPHFLCRLLIFQNQLFRKILSGIRAECQTVWIQIRPNVLSGLIWVQTVCKSYQQTTLGDKESICFNILVLIAHFTIFGMLRVQLLYYERQRDHEHHLSGVYCGKKDKYVTAS